MTKVRSMMPQPSSKTRLPIRTPSNRQTSGLNGVPLKSARYRLCGDIFQYRSCHQK